MGLWSKAVHFIGNMVPFRMQTLTASACPFDCCSFRKKKKISDAKFQNLNICILVTDSLKWCCFLLLRRGQTGRIVERLPARLLTTSEQSGGCNLQTKYKAILHVETGENDGHYGQSPTVGGHYIPPL
jgi:hypothetical protein